MGRFDLFVDPEFRLLVVEGEEFETKDLGRFETALLLLFLRLFEPVLRQLLAELRLLLPGRSLAL